MIYGQIYGLTKKLGGQVQAGLTRSTTYKLQSPPSSTLSGLADSGLKGMTAEEALALGSYLVPPLPSLPPPPPTPPLFRLSLSAMTLLNSLTRSLGGQLAPWMTVWSSSSRAWTRRVQTRETRWVRGEVEGRRRGPSCVRTSSNLVVRFKRTDLACKGGWDSGQYNAVTGDRTG